MLVPPTKLKIGDLPYYYSLSTPVALGGRNPGRPGATGCSCRGENHSGLRDSNPLAPIEHPDIKEPAVIFDGRF